MNRSISEWDHWSSRLTGGFEPSTGWNAQCLRQSVESELPGSAGHGAPRLIHAVSASIAVLGSFAFGGILSTPSCRIADSRRLLSGSNSLIAGPDSPPLSSDLRESSRNPAVCFFGP